MPLTNSKVRVNWTCGASKTTGIVSQAGKSNKSCNVDASAVDTEEK